MITRWACPWPNAFTVVKKNFFSFREMWINNIYCQFHRNLGGSEIHLQVLPGPQDNVSFSQSLQSEANSSSIHPKHNIYSNPLGAPWDTALLPWQWRVGMNSQRELGSRGKWEGDLRGWVLRKDFLSGALLRRLLPAGSKLRIATTSWVQVDKMCRPDKGRGHQMTSKSLPLWHSGSNPTVTSK